MNSRAFFVATLMTSLPGVTHAQRAAPDSAPVANIARMESQFFKSWREAWRDTLNKLIPPSRFNSDNEERTFLSAHDHNAYAAKYLHARCPTAQGVNLSIIKSAANGPAVCPYWGNPQLESNAASSSTLVPVDPAVQVALRGALLSQRKAIVASLESAGRERPSSEWIIGQRVRFLLDDRNGAGALAAVRKCTANQWWCSALTGYVLYTRGSIAGADSAFRAAIAMTSGEARCDWTNIGMLLGDWKGEFRDLSFSAALDMKPRAAYGRLSCAKRDSLSTTAFWLADPFWSDSLNERLVEHFARRVALKLRAGVAQDELYNWEPTYGGDARAEMVMRYGWPLRTEWGGKANDELTTAELRSRGQHTLADTPYLTSDYDRSRARVSIPNWNALLDPFHASNAELELRPTGNYPFSAEFMQARPIASITAQQSALLRRQNDVLFAYAANLNAIDVARTPGIRDTIASHLSDSVVAVAVRSTGPGVIERLGTQHLDANARLLVREPIPPVPAIMSVELPHEGARVAARARFPITPPRPLAQMSPGEVGVSEPIILLAPRGDEALPNEPEAALSRMSGTTIFPRGTQTIGVYWETYGFAPGDSVEIAVRVQRYTPQSALAKAAIALNMRGDRNAPVSIAWTEPQPGHGSHAIPGPIQIVSRSIVLNIASLTKGEYWLDIGVRRNGQKEPVVGRRTFVVQ